MRSFLQSLLLLVFLLYAPVLFAKDDEFGRRFNDRAPEALQEAQASQVFSDLKPAAGEESGGQKEPSEEAESEPNAEEGSPREAPAPFLIETSDEQVELILE